MSVWHDDQDTSSNAVVATMIDAVFRIDCQRLPVDHAAALTEAIKARVPWLASDPRAGVHPIHVAGSQNGWERPSADSGGELLLSQRTRLRIRIDCDQAERLISELAGSNLTFNHYSLRIVSGQQRILTPAATVFARYACFDVHKNTATDDDEFVQQVVTASEALGYTPTKVLCGRGQVISVGNGTIQTRSVLLADVPPSYSIKLQESGLGKLRGMGCGIVIQHKDTGAVQSAEQ